MRKSIIFALGLMLGVFGMTGCSKDAANEQINGGVEEFTLISHADAPDTRMVINGDKANGFKTAWEDGDQIGVYATDYVDGDKSNSTLYTCNYYHTATIGSDGKATFTGTIRKTSSNTFNLFAYYPYTAGSDYNDTDYQTGVNCSLASVQTMNGNSFDKSCSYMVAKTGLTVATSSQQNSYEVGNWQFRHTVAFINLGIKDITNSTVSGDEIVKSATIHATDKTLAGDFQFNLENGEMTFTTSKDIVVVNVPADTKLSDLSAWFVVNPFELTANDELEIVITTKTHIITKKVSVAKSFEAANVYTLNLTIDDKCTVADAPKIEVVADGTTLWSEDFSEYKANDVPASAKAYNGNTIIYKFSNKNSKVYADNFAKGTAPELLLSKNKGTWTISDILTGNCSKAVLTFRANQGSTTYWGVSSTTTGITIDEPVVEGDDDKEYVITYSITCSGVEKFDLKFTNSNSSNNTRLDDIKLVADVPTPTITANDIVDVAAAGVTDATATITLKGLDGVTVNAKADGTVVTAASVSGNTLTYTVNKNETFEAREGKITLSAEGADDVTITVSQLAKEAVTLTLSKETVELEATDEETHEDITFESDGDVTVKVCDDAEGTTESKDVWLVAEVKGTAISYMAEANTGAERVAYIVVTATLDGNNIKKSVKVTQKKGASALTESVIYSTEFNYSIVGTSYTSKDEIIGEDADGKQWAIVYGNWNGSKSAQLRVYSTGNFGSVYTKFDLAKVTKATYKAKVSNIALKLNTYYSTDSGTTWIKVDSAKALTTTLTEYTFEVSSTGEYENVRIKFEAAGTKPSSGNYQLTIDDVSVYGMK